MDISNGEGVRVSLFVQGCRFRCPSCFNMDTWDFDGGKPWSKTVEDTFINLGKQEHIQGYSILGGECLDPVNLQEVTKLCKRIKEETGKSIWLWSGYTFEDYISKLEIVNYIDVLIDGQFVQDLADMNLKWRGSSNQKVWRKKFDVFREE